MLLLLLLLFRAADVEFVKIVSKGICGRRTVNGNNLFVNVLDGSLNSEEGRTGDVKESRE